MEEWVGCAVLQKLVVALHVPDQRNTLGWVWERALQWSRAQNRTVTAPTEGLL